jgi:hypothetical protein
LSKNGLLEKRRYSERPPRYEYVLTDLGRDFQPVLTALMAFGNRHFFPDGVASALFDIETGLAAEPVLVDKVSGKPIDGRHFAYGAGPAAEQEVLDRVAFVAGAARKSPINPAGILGRPGKCVVSRRAWRQRSASIAPESACACLSSSPPWPSPAPRKLKRPRLRPTSRCCG